MLEAKDINVRLAALGMTKRELQRILLENGVYAPYDKVSKSIIRPIYPSEQKLNEIISATLIELEKERKEH